LKGVVAKKHSERYHPGERRWVKVKNPSYWRRDPEIEAMQRSRERRTRVLA
jgi:ATP-dependent DNA ligase